MTRSSFFTLVIAALALLFGSLPSRAQSDPGFEATARSLVRLQQLANQLAAGVAQQVAERGISSQDMREEIAVSAAESLARATSCLKRRFFDGAEAFEIEERILELDALADRVNTAGARLGMGTLGRGRAG